MNDKQPFHGPENGPLQPFGAQFAIMLGTFSPNCTFNDIYSAPLPQSSADTDRSQGKSLEAPYMFPELPSAWDLKLPEKIDLLEINSKDLSPSSYYGNIDLGAPLENQYNRYESSQWAAGANNVSYTQKSGTYPSCAQVSKYYGDSGSSGTYCSIQKTAVDGEGFKSCAYYGSNACYNQNKLADLAQSCYNYTASYDPKYADISENTACFSQNPPPSYEMLPQKPLLNQKDAFDINYLSTLDQQTDVASNDESDIIVEDSSSECSEEQEQRLFYETTKCLVCDKQYTPMGLQFYVLTAQNPLTMSSQVPVKNKISEFMKTIASDKNYLCNDCLGLVNTIDHLQLKLDSLIKDLLNKMKAECHRNNIIQPNTSLKRKFGRFRCKKCTKIICVKAYLKNHLKRHKSRGYLCESCGKTSPTLKKFKIHLKIHKKPKTMLISAFKCSNKFCDKTFRSKFHLKEHENFCLSLLPFKCKNAYCNKKFASSTKLKSHMKLKHDKKFIAICSICNIGFVKVSDYKSHMISHSTDKKFSCNKCDKIYKTPSNLNFHLKSHEKALPHICSICRKGFMRKEYHEAHMNNHKGVKNFGCPVCDKKFVSQKNLDAHQKYHEGTVKSNTCNVCKKVITSCFEEHLRVHSNLREFECSVCDMKFNTKNSLSKHHKRKHLNLEDDQVAQSVLSKGLSDVKELKNVLI